MDVFLRYYYSSNSFQWTKHTYISVVQWSNAWMNELQRMLVYYLRLACLIGVAPDTWLNNLEFNTWGDLTLDASLDDIHSLFRASIRAFHFRGVHMMQRPLLRPYAVSNTSCFNDVAFSRMWFVSSTKPFAERNPLISTLFNLRWRRCPVPPCLFSCGEQSPWESPGMASAAASCISNCMYVYTNTKVS